VAPGFKGHVVEIRKGSDIVQGLAAFVSNNQDEKADYPETNALPNNQCTDINASMSNSENPNTDNLPERAESRRLEKQSLTRAEKLRLRKEAEVEGPPCGIEQQIQCSSGCSTWFQEPCR